MNAKFYELSEEKRRKIINAGCYGFYKFGYKASMQFIADEAEISKSLLFFYFKNKKEFFMFLYRYAIEIIIDFDKCLDETDLFIILKKMTHGKCCIAKQHPLMSKFILKASEVKDESIFYDINQMRIDLSKDVLSDMLKRVDQSKFKEGINVKELLDVIIWSGEGLSRQISTLENSHEKIDEIETAFYKLLEFFRHMAYRAEFL